MAIIIIIVIAALLGWFGAGCTIVGSWTGKRAVSLFGFALIWLAIGIGYFAGRWS